MRPKRYLLPFGSHADMLADELNAKHIVRKAPTPLGGRYGQLGNIETKFRCGIAMSMKINRVMVTRPCNTIGGIVAGWFDDGWG